MRGFVGVEPADGLANGGPMAGEGDGRLHACYRSSFGSRGWASLAGAPPLGDLPQSQKKSWVNLNRGFALFPAVHARRAASREQPFTGPAERHEDRPTWGG
jgi:hypothetical protein